MDKLRASEQSGCHKKTNRPSTGGRATHQVLLRSSRINPMMRLHASWIQLENRVCNQQHDSLLITGAFLGHPALKAQGEPFGGAIFHEHDA
jgi:hypothetical protein